MVLLKRWAMVSACLMATVLSAQAATTESFLEAPGPKGALKGTLLAPMLAAKPAPAVLIIPGSGPTDREGNNPLGVKASTYRLLAEGLASNNVASLRIDKRGMFGSAAAVPDANAVTVVDYAADVRAWIAVLKQQTGASCVWLLGHSEGGLVALVAAQHRADVCGLILVATAGRPLGEVLRDQLKANPANGPILSQALPAIDRLEQGQSVDVSNMHPALQGLFNPSVQGFLKSAFSYDPCQLLSGFAKPVLVLQGQRDIQVGVADARLLKQARPEAELLLPDVNHVLKFVGTEDRGANLASYANPALPLAPGVLAAMIDFLNKQAADTKAADTSKR